jgi:hypothetical protein
VWLLYFLNKEKFEFFIFVTDGCYTNMSYIRTDKFLNNLDNNTTAFPISIVRSLIFLSCAIFP